MNEETGLEQSYSELIEIIKAEVRGKDNLMPNLIKHFIPKISQTCNTSITKKIKKMLSFSDKSKISSIDDLVHELENNNVISKTNISSLNVFIDALNNEVLKIKFQNHISLVEKLENMRVEETEKPDRLNEQVRDAVCQGISKKWAELGRQLSMPDESLEQIELKYDVYWRRAAKVLDYLEVKTPLAVEQRPVLCQALVAIKRTDLAEKIQPLF